jgi:hypothetical protein
MPFLFVTLVGLYDAPALFCRRYQGVALFLIAGIVNCSAVDTQEGNLEYTNATSNIAISNDQCQCKAGFQTAIPSRKLQNVWIYCRGQEHWEPVVGCLRHC